MNTNTLKLFAGSAVAKSEMDKEVKNQFLNFLEDATEHQVKAFLLDAQIINVPNDAFCEGLIDQRFNMSEIPDALDSFIYEWIFVEKRAPKGKYREYESTFKKILKYGAAGLVGAPLGFIFPMFAFWLYRRFTDKCTKSCGGGMTASKACYDRCYLMASQGVVKEIKKDISSLSRVKDEKQREKMREKFAKELTKWNEKVQMYNNRVRAGREVFVK